MVDPDRWDPAVDIPLHAFPGDVALVAATAERSVPQPGYPPVKLAQRLFVEWDSVISQVSLHHALEPLPDLWDRVVHPHPQLSLDLCKLGP